MRKILIKINNKTISKQRKFLMTFYFVFQHKDDDFQMETEKYLIIGLQIGNTVGQVNKKKCQLDKIKMLLF